RCMGSPRSGRSPGRAVSLGKHFPDIFASLRVFSRGARTLRPRLDPGGGFVCMEDVRRALGSRSTLFYLRRPRDRRGHTVRRFLNLLGIMKRSFAGAALVMLGALSGCDSGPTRSEPLLWVYIAPMTATLHAVGDSIQLFVYAANGAGYPVSTEAARWSSLDEAVASVNPRGLVFARSAGVARIRVEVLGPGNAGMATITVRPAPAPAAP
ncbi:MAG TPA: hypothetical protein VHG28_16050, partial [Longimicrobiaceae bacterium]|nr:hypothetical protein [Longimicrobiaceae bacterium]